MQTTRARVDGQDIMMGAVDQAAGNAAGATSSVTTKSVSAPSESPNPPLQKVDGSRTLQNADMLHDQNRREEAGKGHIQTTATGMAKELLGKTTTGIVDSQGMRTTDEGFFDPRIEVSNPQDLPPVAPVSKNASSTIGGKK